MTIEQEILEELRRGTSLTDLRRRYRSQSQLYGALRQYLQETDKIVDEHTENLNDISIALTSTIRQLDSSLRGPRRICISLISDVLLQHHAIETRRWLTALMTKLKSEDFTTRACVGVEVRVVSSQWQ